MAIWSTVTYLGETEEGVVFTEFDEPADGQAVVIWRVNPDGSTEEALRLEGDMRPKQSLDRIFKRTYNIVRPAFSDNVVSQEGTLKFEEVELSGKFYNTALNRSGGSHQIATQARLLIVEGGTYRIQWGTQLNMEGVITRFKQSIFTENNQNYSIHFQPLRLLSEAGSSRLYQAAENNIVNKGVPGASRQQELYTPADLAEKVGEVQNAVKRVLSAGSGYYLKAREIVGTE